MQTTASASQTCSYILEDTLAFNMLERETMIFSEILPITTWAVSDDTKMEATRTTQHRGLSAPLRSSALLALNRQNVHTLFIFISHKYIMHLLLRVREYI